MEQLWSRNLNIPSNQVSTLSRLADFVLKHLENASEGEAILLKIELQAIVQVLIHHLASRLDPKQTHKLGDFQNIIDNLNK